MPLFRRPDGIVVKGLGPTRYIMPYIMRTRTESAVYYTQVIDLDNTLAYLDKKNEGREEKLKVFHVFIAACARALAMRPKMNRFVKGHMIYQRNNIAISFALKKEFSDEGHMREVKIEFTPEDTLDTVHRKVLDSIHYGRKAEITETEKEIDIFKKIPPAVLAPLARMLMSLDNFNLMPGSMMTHDPLYASIFVANLGSIGLDAVYHHLYEYGTVSIFGAMGLVKEVKDIRDDGTVGKRKVVTINWTYDERIADGYYASKTLDLVKHFMEHPEELEKPCSDCPTPT